MPADSVHCLALADQALANACRLLVLASPPDIEQCEHALAAAIAELSAERQNWTDHPPRDAARIHQLRSRLNVLSRLVENGRRHYTSWQQIAAAMTCGYTPDGIPAPIDERGNLSLAG